VNRTSHGTCRTVRVELKGGLGNQLHQYSAGFVTARNLGARLVLSHSEAALVHDGVGLNALSGLSGGSLSRVPIHLAPRFSRPFINSFAFRFRSAAANQPATVIDERAFYGHTYCREGNRFCLTGYFQDWRTARTAMSLGAFKDVQPRRPSRNYIALERDIAA
jgi:hypothetical protein